MLKVQKKTHVKHECEYYIVFCTKYRKEILVGEVKACVEQGIEAFFEQEGLQLDELTVASNYVSMRVHIDPQLSVSQVVRRLKSDTSSRLRQSFERLTKILPSIWTFNYWCTTKGPLTTGAILEYVESQSKRES